MPYIFGKMLMCVLIYHLEALVLLNISFPYVVKIKDVRLCLQDHNIISALNIPLSFKSLKLISLDLSLLLVLTEITTTKTKNKK